MVVPRTYPSLVTLGGIHEMCIHDTHTPKHTLAHTQGYPGDTHTGPLWIKISSFLLLFYVRWMHFPWRRGSKFKAWWGGGHLFSAFEVSPLKKRGFEFKALDRTNRSERDRNGNVRRVARRPLPSACVCVCVCAAYLCVWVEGTHLDARLPSSLELPVRHYGQV